MIVTIAYAVLFLLPCFLFTAYYGVFVAARLLGARANRPEGNNATHSFAVVIPAHNEEAVIADTLRSCSQLDYPEDKYQVYVIADNCTDRTAEVVEGFGFTCLERHDPQRAGKGQALQWGFEEVLPAGHDAVVVLDADCRIDGHALRVFDRCLEEGDRVLQAHYSVSNPDASPISYVARVGNTMEYELFYAPKSCLGLTVMLVGTGMVFHRRLLDKQPWHAHSLVEDVEYTLDLARRGTRVKFVANVRVFQAAAERVEQLKVQRSRWAGGTMALSKSATLRLIGEGIVNRRPLLLDAAWTLLALSRPLVLFYLLITVGLGAALAMSLPGGAPNVLFQLALVLLLTQGLYFGVGIVMVGLSARRICLLLSAPLVVARLVVISLTSLLGPRCTRWERMPR